MGQARTRYYGYHHDDSYVIMDESMERKGGNGSLCIFILISNFIYIEEIFNYILK
jgi:hypothetical protein